jgi:glucose uptake protein GlcU
VSCVTHHYPPQVLGSTLGFPLTQTCIVVTGLWGILFFRELSGRAAIAQFSLSVLLILSGAGLLSAFG